MSIERVGEELITAEVPKLKRLIMQLTAKCNSNCYFCMNGGTTKDDIPFNVQHYKKVLHEFAKSTQENIQLENVSFTGGEPLMEKQLLLELAEFNKSLGLSTMLVSNAILMTPELAIDLYKNGVQMARVSMDTYRAEEYDSIRGVEDGFENAIQGIKSMLDAGIKVIIRYTLTKRNLVDLLETYKMCNALGVHEFQLRVVSPHGRSCSYYMPNPKEVENSFNSLFDIEDKVPITTPCFFFGPCTQLNIKNRMKACPCAREWAYVKIDGNMYPCNYFPEYTKIGNLFSDDINKLWAENEYLEKIRNHIPKACEGCQSWENCFNQCQGLVYTLTEGFDETCFTAVCEIASNS